MCRKINHSARSSRAFFMGIDMAKSKSPRKAYRPKPISNDMANKIVYSRLFRSSMQPISGEQIMALILPFRATIDALQRGRLDLEGWTRLNEMNLFSFELASRLWNATSNEEAKRQIEPSRDTFEQAAEALYRIGLRWRDKQKFGATGDELTWLRESANWLEELLQVSPEGMALEAMMKAEQDVRDYWRRGEQAA